MTDRKDTKRMVETYLGSIETPAGDRVDEKVLPAALTAMHKSKPHVAPASHSIWRTIMTSKAGKVTAAAVVAVVVLFAVFDSFTQPAWALADAIEALKDYRAVHVTGVFPGGTAEVWFRANEAKTQSTDVVVRGSLGATTWTRDGSTYHYEPGQNTVYYEPAVTIGMSQWFGPELLEMFRTAQSTQIIQGKDPATGRDRVMLMCSLIDVRGPRSWVMEFDADSKLPVAMKQWQNLDRSGPPSFDAFKIVYYEDLPDSVFDVQVPGDAKRVEKPLQIPEETVGILANPQDGISAEGMTQQEAAQKIVRALYEAVIKQDMNGLKGLSPLCRNWGDDFLRKIVFKPDRDDRIVEIIEIGQILRTGQSSLGPIAAVPVTLKLKNGKKVQEQMIVQFRSMGDRSSCVIHGPYGIAREIGQ
ncbi:MAG TPA: hypothetical protein VLI39_09920 [Sedimentisphaerales bacterium]|nr:hypothetical protein [Sedimentisphaerales bacterium]